MWKGYLSSVWSYNCSSLQLKFTTKACGKVFKIQSGLLNFNSKKVLCFLRYKNCDDTPYIRKAKTTFRFRFSNYKIKHWSFRKGKYSVLQKRFHSHSIQDCHKGIDDWEVTLFEKCKTHKQLKTFYPLYFNIN